MLIFVVFFGFYVGGWHSSRIDLLDPHRLFRITQQSISFLAILPALIAVLLFSHEFRYNLASYSLTISKSRSRVLVAKFIVVSIIALVSTGLVGVLSPLLALAGMDANHLHIVHQSYYFVNIVWRGLFYGWGYSIIGLVIAMLVREQIGALVTLLIFPTLVEGLLSIWLTSNTVYLPFSALHSELGVGLNVAKTNLSPINSLYVFLGYVIVGSIIGWILFLRRDAA